MASRILNPSLKERPGGSDCSTIQQVSTGEALSRRESEIVFLLKRGLTNKDIAEHLFISIETVKTHMRHILKKLGARNRTDAVIKAASLRSNPQVCPYFSDLAATNQIAYELGLPGRASMESAYVSSTHVREK